MTYQLIENGCNLEEHFKHTLRKKVGNLLEVCPLDATARSSIIKTHHGYMAVLHIFSSRAKFSTEAIGSSVDELFEHLFPKIYRQIREWKISNFRATT